MATQTSLVGPENLIEIVRGTTKTFELEVKDSAGEFVDLTGATVVASVKCEIVDEHPIIQKSSDAGPGQVDITDPKLGKAKIKFVPSDTQTRDVGEYVFDVWVVLSSGARYVVVGPAPFKIKPGVTVL